MTDAGCPFPRKFDAFVLCWPETGTQFPNRALKCAQPAFYREPKGIPTKRTGKSLQKIKKRVNSGCFQGVLAFLKFQGIFRVFYGNALSPLWVSFWTLPIVNGYKRSKPALGD